MALIVQKYGGSSVSDVEAIKRVAKRIVETRNAGHKLVVVVSAMGDTTDELLDTAAQITDNAPEREMDILLTAGERISMSLLSMAINELGVPAQAFTGAQAGIHTTSAYGRAQITGMVPERVARSISEGQVAIVAGFQGISDDDDVTTLGRGGSDTTAVALAAALHADVCEIYTDVDGLFSADPRIVPKAHRLRSISTEETLELAAHGAKILHLRAVAGVPNHPGRAAMVFQTIAAAGANIDMIVQNIPVADPTRANITFTIPEADAQVALDALESAKEEIGFKEVRYNPNIGKLSLVGTGMRTNPGVAARLFAALSEAGINIDLISSSEIRLSIVTKLDDLDRAVAVVHSAFGLDAEVSEAVVYAGTGR